jgi:hypothetical protein
MHDSKKWKIMQAFSGCEETIPLSYNTQQLQALFTDAG